MKLRHKPVKNRAYFLLLDTIFSLCVPLMDRKITKFLADAIKKFGQILCCQYMWHHCKMNECSINSILKCLPHLEIPYIIKISAQVTKMLMKTNFIYITVQSINLLTEYAFHSKLHIIILSNIFSQNNINKEKVSFLSSDYVTENTSEPSNYS